MRIATDLYTKVTRSCKYLPIDFLESQYATISNLNSMDWISCFLVSTCHRPAKPPESSSKWINGNLEPQSNLQLHHALANCTGLWTPLSVLSMIKKNSKHRASDLCAEKTCYKTCLMQNSKPWLPQLLLENEYISWCVSSIGDSGIKQEMHLSFSPLLQLVPLFEPFCFVSLQHVRTPAKWHYARTATDITMTAALFISFRLGMT